ncbi:efflux RND transporter periplasmic adaptor subunit [Haloferula sp. BvORR071]|uniref:efflux RND transporter periplasmic adaptor subunit n=1 Tax=Haloferula sp. BvORR071 TaxID=1396141 RepID=UPI00054CFAAE|nr:efflux RND transporter periplasmic adaptor subunit [Haloferula sp. BvORR071]
MKTLLTVIITALIAATATWFAKDRFAHSPAAPTTSGERKVLYYQSAMHPWIKSDKPGRCTICGMELTPVYEGEKGFDNAGGENVVALTQSQIQVLHVETAEARQQQLDRKLHVAGMIDDNATRHRILSAYVDGRVEKLHVNYIGAEVTEGQPLADFYSPTLLQAEREYRQLTGELKSNTGLRLRQMGLTKEQIAKLESKPAEVLSSEIIAPMSGTVVAQNVYEGQYVATGEKLFEIADFSTMWFMFRAYEMDMPWIQIGQIVRVTTPAIPGKSFEGKITFIDPNFDEATRSTKIRVELPNPLVDGRRTLLHRLYADGEVQITTPSVLSVPRSSVIETGREAVVYIDREGAAYERAVVRLGRRGDQLVEILSGLNAGDHVVTNGNLLLDGQAEMNRSFMTGSEPKKAKPGASLNNEQQVAVNEFLNLADAMAKALSADDLAAFNEASKPAMEATDKLTTALAGKSEKLSELSDARHFHGSKDLVDARKAFHRFAQAAAAVLEPLRTMEGTPKFHLWECPMVDRAIPGVPKKARWLQTGDRPGANPFFGAEMQDCGKEIQP